MNEKIEELIELFNDIASDVLEVPGVPEANEILESASPQGAFNHMAYVKMGYISKLSVSRLSAENERIRSGKTRVINQPIKGLFTGTRATPPQSHDSPEEILELLRAMSKNGIPFVKKVQERMKGNFPKFSRDTRKPMTRRLFVYRVKDESIFLHVLYNQWNRPPLLYLSNFHTNTFSSVPKTPPLIAIYCNLFVGGIEPSLANISGQPSIHNRWAAYFIEFRVREFSLDKSDRKRLFNGTK